MSPCDNAHGHRKERFASERAARRAFCHKQAFRHRRVPTFYHCPECHGWHAGHSAWAA